MSDSADDQIHSATPARREQARRDGDIPKSFELAAALQMIGAIVVAYMLLGQVGNWICTWADETWSVAGTNIAVEAADVTSQAQNLIGLTLAVLAPMLLLLMAVGICSHWIQTGPIFLTKKVAPDVGRLGPGSWKRKLFSLEGLALLFVGIPKTAIAFVVLGFSTWSHRMTDQQLRDELRTQNGDPQVRARQRNLRRV